MWLNLFTMLRRGSFAALLLLGAAAQAATLNFNGGAAGGCTLSGNTYTCSSLSLADTDVVSIASNYKVVVNSALTFSYNQSLKMSGSAQLQTSGNLSIADINPANLAVSGGTLTTSGNFKIGSQAQTIVADVNAATMTIGSGSTTKITGTVTATSRIDIASHVTIVGPITAPVLTTNSGVTLNGNINSTTSFQLASGSSVTGNISSPSIKFDSSGSTVKGDVSTSGTLDVGSQVSVTGSVTAAGLVLRASSAVINGTTKISGDVVMESGTTINGDLSARNVTTNSGSAVINGNASVNAIYIDWNNSVNGVITCTGALNGTEPCSCVSKPQYYNYTPRCAAAPSSNVHHFQISHPGSALTCQAQSIEIKACANEDCTSTVTGSTSMTLLPSNTPLTFTGTTTQSIRQPTAATITLGASGGGATSATVCPNAATKSDNCALKFEDKGLILSVSQPAHLAWASGIKLNIQALQNSAGTCVPLVKGTTPIAFSCDYVNPVSGANAVPVLIGGKNVQCSGNTSVDLTFDDNGSASASLQYAEVGQTRINASYVKDSLGASGAVEFTTAPASFKVEAVRVSSASQLSPTAFAKASEPFNVRLTALNAKGDPTKNFGRETPPQNFYIDTPAMVEPANGVNAITIGPYKSVVDGAAVPEDGQKGYWRFDETGTIQIKVRQKDSSTYYLGNKTTGFNTNTQLNLTFAPDHFDVLLPPVGAPMSCAGLGALKTPCDGSNPDGKFLYFGQPFALQVNAYIGLKDAQGKYLPAQNYVAGAARTVDISLLGVGGSNPGVSAVKWSNGDTTPRFIFSYDEHNKVTSGTLAPANMLILDFANTIAANAALTTPVAPTTFALRATNADTSSSASFAEPLLTMVTGRMEIGNISGPLKGNVPVKARAQYWNGKAYVFNSLYASDTLSLSRTVGTGKSYYISFSNCRNGLYGGNANAPCAGAPALGLAQGQDSMKFANGEATFYLAQPTGLTRNGSVNVALRDASLENNNDKRLPELIRYLPSGSGTVVFGVYRSGPVIYTREVYN